MSGNTVRAQTYWVWTQKAANKNPRYSKVGEPVWPHYLQAAPAEWLELGLIADSTAKEVMKEGQVDLFDFPGVI